MCMYNALAISRTVIPKMEAHASGWIWGWRGVECVLRRIRGARGGKNYNAKFS
jgi:hypothetical protein